jgi:hypothetical protein
MSRGLAPQRDNRDKGGMESMGLSHEPSPYRDGGTAVIPRWPQDHAAVDPYRFAGVLAMTDLSDVFAEKQSNVIDWNGIPVYGLYEFDELPSRLRLTFVAAKQTPRQGVQLRMRGGTLVTDGHEGSDIVLWQDRSPRRVSIDVRCAGPRKPRLKLWNVWRGGLDVTQAWLGNAAIQLDGNPTSGSFRIRCSDGLGEPNFDDLILQVETE